ncbi:uncharacterized protein LOC122624713 [Drosophila teissieri]|uniref:uncharacterized protein LOC122624713 n=1 Tax=Drosophila teissieri TaxID=7243 RepID=UPI001CB9FEF9|nr:uncharacterized protein LOC122624713 [Drosophila teissieri]
MSSQQKQINVYVPPISGFPEASLLGGYGLQDRIELPKNTTEVLEEVLDERDAHFLYVVDSQGRLLEHIRYYGKDYRMALREALTANVLDRQDTAVDIPMHREQQNEETYQCTQQIN